MLLARKFISSKGDSFFEKALLYGSLLTICFSKQVLPIQMRHAIEVGTKSVMISPLQFLKDSFVKIRFDLRYPYELLIYFDSSVTDGLIDGVGSYWIYNDAEKAMKIMNTIIQKEPNNIPARFCPC